MVDDLKTFIARATWGNGRLIDTSNAWKTHRILLRNNVFPRNSCTVKLRCLAFPTQGLSRIRTYWVWCHMVHTLEGRLCCVNGSDAFLMRSTYACERITWRVTQAKKVALARDDLFNSRESWSIQLFMEFLAVTVASLYRELVYYAMSRHRRPRRQ